jgi:hypothetical protein
MLSNGSNTGVEPGIEDATENVRALFLTLQNRLTERQREIAPPRAGSEDLDLELEKHFSAAAAKRVPLNRILHRVVDGLVDKVVRRWEESPDSQAALENALVERRLHDRLMRSKAPQGATGD